MTSEKNVGVETMKELGTSRPMLYFKFSITLGFLSEKIESFDGFKELSVFKEE
jgi:hypothetical protein